MTWQGAGNMALRVLVPVNDQETALSAIESIMARRWPEETDFMLCTVVEDLTVLPDQIDVVHRESLAAEQKLQQESMGPWLDKAKELFSMAFPDTTARIDLGNIPAKICDIAYEWPADLIIIGSHDFGLVNRLALGSIASSVLRDSPCSVEACRYPKLRELMIKNGTATPEEIREIASKPPKKVLVTSDLSKNAQAAIDWVSDQKWAEGTWLRLITVSRSAKKDLGLTLKEKGGSYVQEREYQRLIENELKVQGLKIANKQPNVKLEVFVVQAESAADGIVESAHSWGADLVITGAQGTTRSRELRVGSNAIAIMNRLHCSMIAIRTEDCSPVHFNWT
jgi:nucleotide-binding universal stress UspA family protein